MITHGNKQISEIVYARKASEGGGAVRLTNIIRGAQVVFGEIDPYVKNWLSDATKAAILAAFGQTDGKAVIKATNAYLNALAATDPTKASALAGFINEDPMLVCSLGLQTQGVAMPIRGLVADGKAWIDFDFTATGGMHIYTKFKAVNSITIPLVGSHDTSHQGGTNNHNRNMLHITDGNWRFNVLNMGRNRDIAISQYGVYTDIEASSISTKTLFIDAEGTRKNITDVSGILAPTNTVRMWYDSYKSSPLSTVGTGCGQVIILDKDENVVCETYPFKRNGQMGLIDVHRDRFLVNQNSQGAFGEEFLLPDGSPWTPLNQTP